jgi:sulfoxide reductase heme-binding subunit YedZ
MLHPLVDLVELARSTVITTPHDAGVRQVAALSARLAYVLTCLALCWGVLVATGWLHRLTGRNATRSSHLVLATLAIAFGALHAAAFLFLTGPIQFDATELTVPFADGLIRHALGIIGIELMIAIAISVMVQRFVSYRRWLWLHRMAYPAVAAIIVHSVLGAVANGHLEELWLGGLTVLAPTVAITVLRFVPAKALVNAGLVEEDE